MKSDLSFTFGHASKQTPHVIHLESSYAHSRFFSGIRGPGPKSCVPSIGIQALICLSASNITSRSTMRSRTTGNVLIGAKRIGCSKLSTNVAQDCLAVPLITIEQAPQTSSKQLISQYTGAVFLPSAVTGFFCISINPEITFMFRRYGMLIVSSSGSYSGQSCLVIIKLISVFAAIFNFHPLMFLSIVTQYCFYK